MSISRIIPALTRTAPKVAAPAVPKRAVSQFAGPPTVPAMYNKSVKDIWLSDPGVYPIVVIISGACVFCGSYYLHNLVTNPDIRISKTTRKATYRTWSMTAWGHH